MTIGGAVERTLWPASEHHQSMILCGPGGKGKTKLWRYLLPDDRFYVESINLRDLEDPKVAIERVGNGVICEIAEVSAMSGKNDIGTAQVGSLQPEDAGQDGLRRTDPRP